MANKMGSKKVGSKYTGTTKRANTQMLAREFGHGMIDVELGTKRNGDVLHSIFLIRGIHKYAKEHPVEYQKLVEMDAFNYDMLYDPELKELPKHYEVHYPEDCREILGEPITTIEQFLYVLKNHGLEYTSSDGIIRGLY